MSKLWRHKDDHVADCADQTWVPRLLHSLPPLSLYSMQLPSLLSSNAIVSLLYLAFKNTLKLGCLLNMIFLFHSSVKTITGALSYLSLEASAFPKLFRAFLTRLV